MGKIYSELTDELKKWISNQKIFFVATAPLGGDGHLNVSPKGLDTLRIIDNQTVAYLDLHGSGVETMAHLKENGRITIMMTAFEGPPKTLRIYGNGEALKYGSKQYDELKSHFDQHLGARSIIKINITRIQDSCGYSIPIYEFKGDRTVYDKYCKNKGRSNIEDSIRSNQESIDNLKI